jgi:MFS family permease
VVPIYSFAYFAPTIIKTLGYSVVQTQLHTVPPVAAALVLAIIIAYFSDRTQLRAPYIAFCFALTIVGLSILITTQQSFSAKYAGICLIAMGAFSAGPVVICWFVMNLHSHARRSIGTAWVIGFGNIGGIVATFAFLASDAPHYVKGYTICLAVTAVGAVAIALYALLLWQENKQLRAAPEPKEDGTEVIHNSL